MGVAARVVLLSAIVAIAGCSRIEDPTLYPEADASSLAAPPPKTSVAFASTRNLLWGDLHIHTSLSYDAFTNGVRALPDDAYTHMKGGAIKHAAGYAIQNSRPLDFGAVTDHAEFMGIAREIGDDPEGKRLREVLTTGSALRMTLFFLRETLKMSSSEKRRESFGRDGMEAVSATAWELVQQAAERHNDPGRFTTFVGYEWTSMPAEQNLHRNVIYRGNKVPPRPFSAENSDNPEDLWRALDAQRAAGMDAIAIPHNGNLSNGLMYARTAFDGSALDSEYAAIRVRNEPVSEMLQIKGSSETHPELSPADEFAGFEVVETMLSAEGADSQPRGSYVRDALRTGMELAVSTGANPYRLGFIGSTDSHNASNAVEENNYHGKLPMLDGTAGMRNGLSLLLPDEYKRAQAWNAQGLAAVWATENTRDAIFEAMQRRETYATSGPRIALRFFGGWHFEADWLTDPDLLRKAYRRGVPMGGVLPLRSSDRAPRFIITALKDSEGANLDRVQIIKGWVDDSGQSHEKVYNVVASDGRKVDQAGKLKPVGNTVDVASASYTNSIGTSNLAAVWEDPAFDPRQDAFYYARVLEIPTPRYSTYDALALGVPAPAPQTLQERAISSPIWYSASGL